MEPRANCGVGRVSGVQRRSIGVLNRSETATNDAQPSIERTRDGLGLSGWLYRSYAGKGPGPIVLSFHGGPEGQERPIFNSTYQVLLARGITVFAPNVRGSSGFGKKFVNLDNGAPRENATRDIKASVDQVFKMAVADPRRIGIMVGTW